MTIEKAHKTHKIISKNILKEFIELFLVIVQIFINFLHCVFDA